MKEKVKIFNILRSSEPKTCKGVKHFVERCLLLSLWFFFILGFSDQVFCPSSHHQVDKKIQHLAIYGNTPKTCSVVTLTTGALHVLDKYTRCIIETKHIGECVMVVSIGIVDGLYIYYL